MRIVEKAAAISRKEEGATDETRDKRDKRKDKEGTNGTRYKTGGTTKAVAANGLNWERGSSEATRQKK